MTGTVDADVLLGHVRNVTEGNISTATTAAASAGATTVTVQSTSILPAEGGSVKINGQVVSYTGYDSANVVTLTAPLTAAAADGDEVALYDAELELVAVEKKALVDIDGHGPDSLAVTVSHDLADTLASGPRDGNGEAVLCRRDGGEWWLVQVIGKPLRRDGYFSNTADNGTRVTLTITKDPFGLNEDWAVFEFWADDPDLAPGKLWARFNAADDYASIVLASPAVAGSEDHAAQLILSKKTDGTQLATLVADIIKMYAQSYFFGSTDDSSVDFHTVGTSLFQLFSSNDDDTGFLNFNLTDPAQHSIGAWNAPGVRKALQLLAESFELDGGPVVLTDLATTGSSVDAGARFCRVGNNGRLFASADPPASLQATLNSLQDQINDLAGRVNALEHP